MGLTPAPMNLWPFAWIALAPLWILIVDADRPQQLTGAAHRYPNRLFLGCALAWGLGYHGLALFWITGIHPMTWMGVPWLASLAIALFCWIFISLWGAALVTVWGAGMRRVIRRQEAEGRRQKAGGRLLYPWLRVLVGVALWCGLETLWSASPLWWSSLAYTQSPYNLAILHLGQLSGPTAVTAAIVAVNGLLAEAWFAYRRSALSPKSAHLPIPVVSLSLLSVGLAFALGSHLLGFVLFQHPLADSPPMALKVGIVQGNIPNTIKLYQAGWRRAIEGYTRGYNTLVEEGADAVLTPETALPFSWRWPDRNQLSFHQAIVDRNVPAWVGAFGDRQFTNSLFSVLGNGETLSRYDKVKLVPLGEYVPFSRWLSHLVKRLSPLEAQMVAGHPNQQFETPFGRAIAAICYESAFPNRFRHQTAAGGQFILSVSNDAHYSPTMPAQHHALDIMRAIETDRWAARATNTGYSAIVDPHGRTRWQSLLNTYTLHLGTLYRRQTQTLYVRWGDWLAPTLLLLAAIAAILTLWH